VNQLIGAPNSVSFKQGATSSRWDIGAGEGNRTLVFSLEVSGFPECFQSPFRHLQLFGRLRSLQNFPLSEWSCEPHERSPSLWKSVKYGRQRLYQQNGASAQHARPHHEQGQDAFPKLLVAGDVIRVWHLFAPAFSVRRRCHRPSRGIADRLNLPEN
jgi:hypothetical protein